MVDPDLQIRGGGGVGHPDPEIKGGPGLKNVFWPFWPQFGLKIRGLSWPPGPSSGSAPGLVFGKRAFFILFFLNMLTNSIIFPDLNF